MNEVTPPSGSFINLSEYSSNLNTLTWNGDGTMDVTFQKMPDRVYRYHECPDNLWHYLLGGAERQDKTDNYSIGAAFHQEVISKSDLYPVRRIR